MKKYPIRVPLNLTDENGWYVESEDGYLAFPKQDNSGIAVNVWEQLRTCKSHRHEFYEFVLITKGCCQHQYNGVDVPLIPGDVFLIQPQEFHGYYVKAPVELVNCQFFFEDMGAECKETIKSAKVKMQSSHSVYELQKRWEELVQNIAELDANHNGQFQTWQNNLNKQGIIHLNVEERRELEYLLERMMYEQEEQKEGLEYVKSACLQMILVLFRRVSLKQLQSATLHRDSKRDYIYETLTYMEEHLDEKLDMDELAKNSYWSKGHFRSVFKSVTGLSPVEYLNRLRIIKSLEYLGSEQVTVAEAAERVGIYDPGYYSRLFKKIMGYSPKYFKKIA